MEIGYTLFYKQDVEKYVCKAEFLPDVCHVLNGTPYEELFPGESDGEQRDLHQAENLFIQKLVEEFNNTNQYGPVSAKNIFLDFEDESEKRAYLRINLTHGNKPSPY